MVVVFKVIWQGARIWEGGREGRTWGGGWEDRTSADGRLLLLTITNLVYKREEDSRLQLEGQLFDLVSSCGHPYLILLQK